MSEPVQLVLRDERGVVHHGWQILGGAMRMGCSYYSLEWTDASAEAITCVWCLANYHPWLSWGPGAPPVEPGRDGYYPPKDDPWA